MILAWLAAAFIAGVVLGLSVPLLLLFGITLLSAAVAWRVPRARLPALLIISLALGMARGAERSQHDPLRPYEGHSVQMLGVVAEEPDVRDTGINYVVDVRQVLTSAHGWQRLSGRVTVHTSRAVILEYGNLVRLAGRLQRPPNTSALPMRDILLRRGITATMDFPRIASAGVEATGPSGWIASLRSRIEAGIDAWLPEPEAALLIAITLGSRSAALGDLAPLLVATGLIHIIAISGIKVAMVAGIVQQTVRALWSRALSFGAGLAVLWTYVLLTGATVSGERSAIMWTFVFVGAYLGRGTVALVSLSLTAAGMVAVDPTLPWDPSFLLTTLGTFSIVAFTPPLLRLLRRVVSPIREAFGVTLAAQIGTLPVVATSFHSLALTGPIANALVLPLLPLLIALGFAVGLLSQWYLVVAPLAALAEGVLRLIVALVTGLAGLPGDIPITSITRAVFVAYYAALALVAGSYLRRSHWAPAGGRPATARELSVGATLGLVVVTGAVLGAGSPSPARVTWLGTGGAILIRSANHTVLVDGGPKPYRLLERLGAALPFGERSIDTVVVTDPRAKNIVALGEVLRHYRVGEVLDVGVQYPSTTYASWRAALRARRVPVYGLRTGAAAVIGSLRLRALGPDALYPRPQDSIGLLRVSFPDETILISGAADAREQTEAVFRPVRLHADELVALRSAGIVPMFRRHVHPSLLVRLPDDAPAPVPLLR